MSGRFLDYSSLPVWIGGVDVPSYNTTYDYGKTWNVEQQQLIYGSYFFLGQEMTLHNRNLYTVSDMLSDFGGIYQTFILALFYYFGTSINKRIMMAKLIRSLYHVEK